MKHYINTKTELSMKRVPVKNNNKKKSITNGMKKVKKERNAFKKCNVPPTQKKGKQMRQKSCRREELGRVLFCLDKKNEFPMKRHPGQNIEKVDNTNEMNKVIKEKNSLKRNVVKAVKTTKAVPTHETVKQR